ncbi:NAD(P)/FAD-dependent oxidoreductase [Macrococcus carouselicus]|uniref:FAD-binding oxidoreductase n=1 Tax=Macrococcus carouselicus TaxID=69969 RepID=A0A9Q8CHA5_9STAP|nr:FAD-binding oxidoreductase [Macrococcus carouselicus]TDM00674.1 FAD-binding oxidoreductase [Macrococcus carouselicus]
MLHNGDIFWPETFEGKAFPVLKESLRCQVVVIGGGMSGAMSAFTFAQAGYQTVLIDQGQIAAESSAANTGLLQYMSDKSLHECVEDFGEYDAYHFYRQSYEGLSRIESLCRELPDDVQFIKRESVLYASKKRDARHLKKEYITLRKYGFPCQLLDRAELQTRYRIEAEAALITYEDAEINPYVFIHRLIEKAVNEFGLLVYEQTGMKKWKSKNGKVLCQTDKGYTLTAEHAIYAGGYADTHFVKWVRKRKLVRSYALVSEPVGQLWPRNAMIWETARPYLYIRHAEGGRVIVGGLDDNTKRIPNKRKIKKKTDQLKRSFERIFPDISLEIEERYGARFGETKDGLPFIGEVPGKKNCYMLLGYGGNGTVYSSFGSKMLLDMVAGRRSEIQQIFRLNR